MKAATAAASSGCSQMESSRAVADESRMDVEGKERDESRSSTEPNTRRIVGREQKRRESGGSDHPRVVRWDLWEGYEVASVDELETGSSSQEGQRMTGQGKPMSL